MSSSMTVLFSGYAPVHYLCFEPLYQRLRESDDFEVYVSGGIRSFSEDGTPSYDHEALYSRFDVDPAHVLSVDEIASRSFDILFSAHTNLIAPAETRLGAVQIFHGVSFRNRGLRPENMQCDYYFVVGPYMQRRLAEQGLMAENDPRIVPVGFMKTDRLVDGSLDREKLMSNYRLDGSRPVLVYAPTGAKHNSMNTMGEDVIKRLRDSGKYDLLVKLHDHPKDDLDWHERLASIEDEHTIVVRDDDVIPLLHAADLLITDASSVSSEFSLCDKPMVFLDVPKLLKKMEDAEYKTMDMATWGRKAGLTVNAAEEVCVVVESALQEADDLSSVRREMAQDLFYNPGTSVDAGIAWLRRLHELRIAA
ncbi:MAG: CDP-glycerol glycerophosphotransferase family protein [Halioglobus sp.]